jgi:hypothetical protein
MTAYSIYSQLPSIPGGRLHLQPKTCYAVVTSDPLKMELMQEGEILQSEILKLINFTWNKEEFPDQRKEFIIVPVHRKGDKTDCSNYCGIPPLST